MNWENILKAGSCYRTAYTYVFNEYAKDKKTKVLLIHANVIGDGGDVKCLFYINPEHFFPKDIYQKGFVIYQETYLIFLSNHYLHF